MSHTISNLILAEEEFCPELTDEVCEWAARGGIEHCDPQSSESQRWVATQEISLNTRWAAECSLLSRRASSMFGSRDGGTAPLLWVVIETYRLWLSAVGGRRISQNPSGHIHQPVWDHGGLIPSLVFTQKSTDSFMLYAFLSIRQTKVEGEILHTITYKMKKLTEHG